MKRNVVNRNYIHELWHAYKSELFFFIILLSCVALGHRLSYYIPVPFYEDIILPLQHGALASLCLFVHNGTLFIRGLAKGDKIEVYTTAGHNVYSGTASSASEWTMPLFYQAGYIVKVNDESHKVLKM